MKKHNQSPHPIGFHYKPNQQILRNKQIKSSYMKKISLYFLNIALPFIQMVLKLLLKMPNQIPTGMLLLTNLCKQGRNYYGTINKVIVR